MPQIELNDLRSGCGKAGVNMEQEMICAQARPATAALHLPSPRDGL